MRKNAALRDPPKLLQTEEWADSMFEEDVSDTLVSCPRHHCSDPIPANPPEGLATMIKHAKDLIRQHGDRNSRQFIDLSFQICRALKNVIEHDVRAEEARRWGWPTLPKWSEVPARVMAMKTHILKLILDPAVRKQNVIHDRFLDDLEEIGLGRDYTKLARAKNIPLALYRNARPG